MKLLLKVLFLSLCLVLVLSACAPAPEATGTSPTSSQASASLTSTQTPQSGGVLRVVPRMTSQVFGYGQDFAPAGGLELSYPCLESICGVDSMGNFLPGLATAYEVAPDGKSITFTLRKGVKFHDGSDFNAQAVKWNLEISKKSRLAGTESWVSLPSVDVLDDYTARINLKQYTSILIYQLASGCSRMVSPTAVEKNGIDWAHTHPVGTGPFKFVNFKPDVSITYERNDDYWGSKPYLDGIEYVMIKDDMAASSAMLAGEVDLLFNVTAETGIALRDKGYNVNYGKPNLIALAPDSVNPDSPLSNQKVREAIEYSIDRDSLAKLGNGFWGAINQLSEPNTPGYVTNLEERKYNPEKAKQLLAEAGYASGFTLKLITNQSNIQPPDSCVAVQQFLSKVGISLDLLRIPADQRTAFSEQGWKDGFIAFNVYGGLGYISGLQYNLGGPLFISNLRPPDFINLLNQAASAPDAATAAKISQQLVLTLHNNAAVIPLWVSPQSIYAQQQYVHDAGIYQKGGTSDWNPEKVWLSK